MKILIAANTSWYIFNFRSNLIINLIKLGYTVETLAPSDMYTEKLINIGVKQHHSLKMDMCGMNPFKESMALLEIAKMIRRIRPDIIFCYTPKINIYTSLVARFFRIKTVVNISGIGNSFSSGRLVKNITLILYRIALRKSFRVFFQNFDNQTLFLEKGLVEKTNSERLPGSGVDLNKFRCDENIIYHKKKFVFFLASRLYLEKGIKEYIEAARIIKKKYPETEFQIVGFIGYNNASAITKAEINQWVTEGIIKYFGATDDIKSFYSNADCVVLPSYYNEGVPRTLLEAASMSLPIITTDSVGCRDTVDDGVTGLLCKIKDEIDLASKMERMINMPFEKRIEMGKAGRLKMENEFDESIIISKYLSLLL